VAAAQAHTRTGGAVRRRVQHPVRTGGDGQDPIRGGCAALAEAGRPPDSLTYSAEFVVCTGRDDAEIAKRKSEISREVDELRSKSPTVGTPAEIADKLAAYIKVGVQRVYLQLLDMSDLDHVEFFATEVAPQFG
jgi:alkanesulfonate monooxygenase SsuD/methylene tetrahydromethanopterin reductase-like flavin-dependent oxidoreductase (luciferase family)